MNITLGLCTRDNEDTIEETLTSILKQKRLPDEIIICDKSRDKTLKIIESLLFGVLPLKIINQKGDGVGDAYQQIYLNLCNTDVFVTLQTNLRVEEDWLKKIEMGFEDNPWADIISSSPKAYFTGRNMAIRIETLRRVDGWDNRFLRGEDWDIHIRLKRIGAKSVYVNGINHRWIKKDDTDTIWKSLRKPTSITFLAKYGLWYLKFRPIHVLGDLSSLFLIGCFVTLPIFTYIGLVAIILNILGFGIVHNLFYGWRISLFPRTVKHQFLNGIACLSCLVLRRYKEEEVEIK